MNDDEAFVIDHAERDETDLAVVATIIDPGKNLALEDLGCIDHVDAAFLDDLFPLHLVPFEFHEPPPISLH